METQKQTAVEALVDGLKKEMLLSPEVWRAIRPIIDRAIELERQQLLDAYDSGMSIGRTAEDYYNETYKTELKKN